MSLTEKIEALKVAAAEQTHASQNLAEEVAGKMGAIDAKTDEAKAICSNAAGLLLNQAKNVIAWTKPDALITLYPAKKIGIEDPTIDYGTYAIADSFNPTKLGQDSLVHIADFDSPNWTGGKESWTGTPRNTNTSSWEKQLLKDASGNPCFFNIMDLNHYPRFQSLHAKSNVLKLGADKIPFLILRFTVEGQTHGVNRTFIELLVNSNGASSNYIKQNSDGTFDSHTPKSIVYGGGFISKGFPISLESAGNGDAAGLYNGTALIPMSTLHSGNQEILMVNVGFKTLHIHSFGLAHLDPQGLEID
ncbi:hypothetical protein [Pseudoalteromonas luteoviolacea]|uniref:Uncharacterized protein n=1 Tax=Pseudoalteromonas luteoviolacea NCIMB 1942 TaxID=1365253 RepID=A0A166Z895_9GAMM|nr:hypothetical protein [Pseudoalteromonas luteoviolacea]KZN44041.1 hypothetical protein N482_18080 [Pseudoalteromonas luteoviolacea NCIMB 1942]